MGMKVVTWTPNLIMPGVAKSGTTTLHDLLVAHPRIAGGREKEVRFLIDREDPLCPRQNINNLGLEGWAECFVDQGKGDFDIWLDASPQYQYQDIALRTIAKLDPQPKIIFIVRAPSRRLFSLYQYARYHQRAIPDISSFADFLDQIRHPEESGIRPRMLANAWNDTKYDMMIDRWSKVIDKENLCVVSLDELVTNRQALLGGLCNWLGVSTSGIAKTVVTRSNPTVITRSRALRRVGSRLARRLPENILTRATKDALRNWNSAPLDYSELEANRAILALIEEQFAPNMRRLHQLKQERTTALVQSELAADEN